MGHNRARDNVNKRAQRRKKSDRIIAEKAAKRILEAEKAPAAEPAAADKE